jgi:ABC-type glycerol-3-phosphate transport system permease component
MEGDGRMKKKVFIQVLLYAILIIFAILFMMPMVYLISTSLKPNGALYEFPPRFFPTLKSITIENYIYIIDQEKFYINFLNSTIVAVLTVSIAAVVASALGFCIGRFRFFGRNLLFSFIMLTMIIPGMTLIVPQYELAVKMKVINKLLGLVPFYVAWVIPYSTFMLKGFVENIPKEFDEAIYMDGGSIFTVFTQIILPLAKPGIASISIFNFLTAWEEFPWANTVINDNIKRTLPIAISGFFGQHQFTQWGYVFALSTLSLLPILVVFICFQKYFITGITTGGVKG